MKSLQKGFTLIELMIVVAIIGILAAVAIPQYQDYTTRAKLSNAAKAVASVKEAMVQGYSSDGAFPTLAQLNAAGINLIATKEVTGIAVTGGPTGVVTATLANLGTTVPVGATLVFTASPAAGDTVIKWVASHTLITTGSAAEDFVMKKLNSV
jgi:type IV pilus assembly protein PilA